MAQFDIFRLAAKTFVIDLQTDLIDVPESRIVAPLRLQSGFVALKRLNPTIVIDEETYVIRLQEMGAIRDSALTNVAGTGAHLQDEITRGIDILLHGF